MANNTDCKKCEKPFTSEDQEILVCNKCFHQFHRLCTTIYRDTQLWTRIAKNKIQAWVCDDCITKNPKDTKPKNGSSSDTPKEEKKEKKKEDAKTVASGSATANEGKGVDRDSFE